MTMIEAGMLAGGVGGVAETSNGYSLSIAATIAASVSGVGIPAAIGLILGLAAEATLIAVQVDNIRRDCNL
ncbi:hypothetical protein [Paenarthrobacter sp. Z7-10]|uniref:hypothetical protein n=1 Tax=Paenarthrobacter sp. Z7-10 TaxID=2787635 RepID=UPI0022A9C3D3|nr:hypothetical protein [Paenarthrobacter sp. Z7-10]